MLTAEPGGAPVKMTCVVLLLGGQANTGDPDFYVDIEPVVRRKIRSILAHTSQMRGRTEADMLKQSRENAERARAERPDPCEAMRSNRK